MLLARGANVNMKNRMFGSPLFAAIKGKNIAVIKLLLDNGADANNILNSSGFNAFIVAVRESTLEIVQLLIDNGANMNATDSGGYTAMMLAARVSNLEMVRFLIKNGADVNIKNPYNENCLFPAVASKNVEMVRLLIESGADVNIKNDCGKTLIELANECKIEYKDTYDAHIGWKLSGECEEDRIHREIVALLTTNASLLTEDVPSNSQFKRRKIE